MSGQRGSSAVAAYLRGAGDEVLGELSAAGAQALARRLETCIAAAEEAWPDVQLPPEVYLPYLGRKLAPWLDDLEHPELACTRDLYLAAACHVGASGGLQVFEREVLEPVQRQLRRTGLAADQLEDVVQRLRCDLFVGASPLIQAYQGRGSLRGWTASIGRRLALKMLSQGRKQSTVADEALAFQRAGLDSVSVAVKRSHAAVIRRAIGAALEALTDHDRELLRLQTVDQLSTRDIAQLRGVHHATVARWLVRIRKQVHDQTRRILGEELDMRPSEVDSLIRMAHSQLDVSLERILHTAA